MNYFLTLSLAVIALFTGWIAPASAARGISHVPEVKQFIDTMVQQHQFDHAHLTSLFARTRFHKSIIKAISRPAEKKPWHEYRPIFLTRKRINKGVAFWNTHAETLAQAEREYGVPAGIIVAIIGVETFYGRHKGKYPVVDALSTLAFQYPPRAKFFRSELEQYLLMTREEKIDPISLKGSYAGAMGKPQFISSSFRRYAVDFDKNGVKNIWDNSADAIGSVGNYLRKHGWQPGKPITTPAAIGENSKYKPIVAAGMKPHLTVRQFAQNKIKPAHDIDPDEKGALIELETANGHEYWIGLDNFYAITRYNHSQLYAMAVYQLSEEIKKRRAGQH